jgi:5-methylcytosine-specific restriction endonuclease McrA
LSCRNFRGDDAASLLRIGGVPRDFSKMRAKCADEGRCRVCARPCKPDPAHIVARAQARAGVEHGEHPHNCVPLCRPCHEAYDRRDLDVLPFLAAEERVKAVELYRGDVIGMLERVTGVRWAPRGTGDF